MNPFFFYDEEEWFATNASFDAKVRRLSRVLG
jgi:hypothetical protein